MVVVGKKKLCMLQNLVKITIKNNIEYIKDKGYKTKSKTFVLDIDTLNTNDVFNDKPFTNDKMKCRDCPAYGNGCMLADQIGCIGISKNEKIGIDL